MRFTSSYQRGIESVDRNSRVMIGVYGDEDDLTDNDDVDFLLHGSGHDDLSIASCRSGVAKKVYELVDLSIQDGHSVTMKQLFSTIKQIAQLCTDLWDRGKLDLEIEKNF